MNIEIRLAEIYVRVFLCLPEAKKYFGRFITQEDCEGWDVRVEEGDVKNYPLICPSGIMSPFSEAYLLIPRVSAYLLKYDCALIHGVSFVWHDLSWLITAPSGTGKTTQLHHWLNAFGDEIELINGDKTVLSVKENKEIWLYPSPWTGKEKEAGDVSAPLGGIVILQQADHNAIRRMTPRESVLEIYKQFLNVGETTEEIRAMGRITEMMLESVPIWLLENLGDEASARLAHQTLTEYEGKRHEND